MSLEFSDPVLEFGLLFLRLLGVVLLADEFTELLDFILIAFSLLLLFERLAL